MRRRFPTAEPTAARVGGWRSAPAHRTRTRPLPPRRSPSATTGSPADRCSSLTGRSPRAAHSGECSQFSSGGVEAAASSRRAFALATSASSAVDSGPAVTEYTTSACSRAASPSDGGGMAAAAGCSLIGRVLPNPVTGRWVRYPGAGVHAVATSRKGGGPPMYQRAGDRPPGAESASGRPLPTRSADVTSPSPDAVPAGRQHRGSSAVQRLLEQWQRNGGTVDIVGGGDQFGRGRHVVGDGQFQQRGGHRCGDSRGEHLRVNGR